MRRIVRTSRGPLRIFDGLASSAREPVGVATGFGAVFVPPEGAHDEAQRSGIGTIIDDIQDNSLLRRGGPCAHVTYGIPTAINAGTAAYFLGEGITRDHPGLTDTAMFGPN